jgi:acyl-CoA synthetase (AMP-forming)/AMP-acid ligase II
MNDQLNIIRHLKASAERHPDRHALIMQEKGQTSVITFAELWQRVDSFSVALRANGFSAGERAIVMVPMSVDLYTVMLGIIKMGGIAVFVDPWISLRRIAAFSAFAEPTGFIGVARSHILRLFRKELRALPLTVTTGASIGGIPAKLSLPALLRSYTGDNGAVDGDGTALITFTSGSSGTPKGANRTHRFLNAQYAALSHEFPYQDEDVDMPMFPVFALCNLANGVTSVIPDMDFRKVAEVDAQVILRQMVDYRVTTCTASPPFFDRLADHVLSNETEPFGLRRILTGGAPVNMDQLQRWGRAFGDTPVEIVYGSTEAEPVAHISAKKRLELSRQIATESRGYCTGKPTELLRTKIIRIQKGPVASPPDWAKIELFDGEVGELVVSGDHVCSDYYKSPEAVLENKIVDTEGCTWHRMGDTGYIDDTGAFWLVGRLHSTIIRNGEQYHAQIIEQTVVSKVKDALQVAAVALPDEEMGERIAIVIRAHQSSFSCEEIQSFMEARDLPIDELIFTSKKLPVDPRHNTKIDYDKLRRMILKREL